MFQMHQTSQINSQVQQQVQKISFTPGQIFQGKVLKLFPNNLASVQINGMKMTGILEASLVAGERYWFEVKEARGLPRLKVLESRSQPQTSAHPSDKSSLVNLLRSIGIPYSKSAETVVEALQRQGLSFSREMIQESVQLLQHSSLKQEQTVQIIGQLIQRHLPLTPAVFDAFQTYERSEGISTQLQSLLHMLNQSNDSRASDWAQQVQAIMKKLTVTNSSTTLFQQLITLALSDNETEAETARLLLQRLGMNLNQSELINEVRAILTTNHKEIATVNRSELMTFISQMKEQDIQPFIRHFFRQSPEEVQSRFHALGGEQPLSQAERQLLTQLYRTERAQMQIPPFQFLGSLLGLDYEQMLSRYDIAKELPNLPQQNIKSLLLTIQQQQLPRDIQATVSNLIQTITAQQLLSHEQIGAFHQYLFSVPLQLGTFHTNMTMQWEGQKREDGQLNPDYCRILFYLTLEHLQETVVDVTIQNRIVSVTIHNEQEQPNSIINLLTPMLKQALETKNYHLLQITWKQLKTIDEKVAYSPQRHTPYQGVDIRI